MTNPFQIAAQKRDAVQQPATEQQTKQQTTPQVTNPFKQSAQTTQSAAPASAKVRNPFANAAVSGAVNSPPAASTATVPAPNSVPPKAGQSAGTTISADEFVHESQPKAYDEAQVKHLRDSLEALKNSFPNKEQIGTALRLVGNQLAANGALCKIMAPEDWGLMVAGMRESYGVVIAKKEGKREKNSERAAKQAEVADLLAGLGDFQV